MFEDCLQACNIWLKEPFMDYWGNNNKLQDVSYIQLDFTT